MPLKKKVTKKTFKPKEVNKKVEKKVEKKDTPKKTKKVEVKDTPKKTETKKIDLVNKPEVDMTKFEIPTEGNCTQAQFIHNFRERLVDAGFEVNKRVAKDIMDTYSELLKDVIETCSYRDNVLGATYKNSMTKLRVYPARLETVTEDTLIMPHNKVELRMEYAGMKSDDYKIKGEVSKEDEGIFITNDGEQIEI